MGVEPRYYDCHDTVRSRSRACGYHSRIGVARLAVEVRALGLLGSPEGGTLVVAYLIVVALWERLDSILSIFFD